MDRLVGVVFCKGMDEEKCVGDPSPGVGQHGQHCVAESSHTSTAQIPPVFSAGAVSVISNPLSPHFPCFVSRAS